jgi:hypothetical protein
MNSLVSRISRTQEQTSDTHKTEVYDFDLSARIPTELLSTSYFLYKIFNYGNEDIIISPTGGIAVSHYYKHVSELTTDTGLNGSYIGEEGDPPRCKSTDEDTERFWLLRNDEFKKELAGNGWMIFPKIQQIANYEKNMLNINSSSEVYKRSFSLRNFLKTIRMTDNRDIDYNMVLMDFNELTNFGDDINFIFKGIESFFYMPVKYKDKSLILKLDEFRSLTEPEKEVNTLKRNVPLHIEMGYDSWWTSEMSNRINQIASNYLENNKINGYVLFSEDKKNLVGEISNRQHFEQKTSGIGTGLLLKQAFDLNIFIEELIKEEKREYQDNQAAILKKRKETFKLA